MTNHTMKFHPAMHPLLRDGRKTQTRRVVEDCNGDMPVGEYLDHYELTDGRQAAEFRTEHRLEYCIACPYEIGDTITVEGTDIRLTVTAIRCERLQGISARDCEAFGVQVASNGAFYSPILGDHITWCRPLAPFAATWGEIYPEGRKSWTANPAVWVVEFERLEGGNGDV